MAKRIYVTDKSVGIRTITQIGGLTMNELTDDEICKLFFRRFEAKALIMVYVDKDDQEFIFGRLYGQSKWVSQYRRLLQLVERVRYFWNWKAISNETNPLS